MERVKIMSEIQTLKQNFIHFLETRGEYFRKVHEGQYRIRCPFCGDTQKNWNEGHLYIKCDLDNDYDIAYNCFKCNESSPRMTEELLNLLGCDEELLKGFTDKKYAMKKYKKQVSKMMYFDYHLPEIELGLKTKYIDSRLNIHFRKEDYQSMKVITSLYDFLATNRIKERPFNNQILQLLQRDYVGFLTNGNSHILFRDITNRNKFSWIKYPITKDSMNNRVFYTIQNEDGIDIFSKDNIIINMSEGIFDCLGVGYHFNNIKYNTMNISVAGQFYEPMIRFLIELGLVGGNVEINIYCDNDETFNRDNSKKSYRSSVGYLKKSLQKYKFLFKRINLYKNTKTKDFGVPRNQISVKKEIVY